MSAQSAARGETDLAVDLVIALHAYEQQQAALFNAGGRLALAASNLQGAVAAEIGYLGGHDILGSIAEAQAHACRSMSSTAIAHARLAKLANARGYHLGDGDGGSFGDVNKSPSAVMRVFLAAQDGESERGHA